MEILLTTSGAAHRLRVAEGTVRRWADTGRLRIVARLHDGSRLFSAVEVEALMQQIGERRR
jgi:excisionase family DNA binding protein